MASARRCPVRHQRGLAPVAILYLGRIGAVCDYTAPFRLTNLRGRNVAVGVAYFPTLLCIGTIRGPPTELTAAGAATGTRGAVPSLGARASARRTAPRPARVLTSRLTGIVAAAVAAVVVSAANGKQQHRGKGDDRNA